VPIECDDAIAEAIAAEARCCGGIANDIWEAAMKAAPEVPGIELEPVDWSQWKAGDIIRYMGSPDGPGRRIGSRNMTMDKDYRVFEAPDIQRFVVVADDSGARFTAYTEDYCFMARKGYSSLQHVRELNEEIERLKAQLSSDQEQ
jgi:hypothetical protein